MCCNCCYCCSWECCCCCCCCCPYWGQSSLQCAEVQQRLAITLAVFISLFSGQAELELRQVTRQCCAWASAAPLFPFLYPYSPPLPLLTMTRHRKLKMFSFECTKRRRVDCCCCCLLCALLLLLYRLLLLFRLLLFSLLLFPSSLLLLLLPVGATLAIFFLLLLFAHSFFSFCFAFGFFVRTLPQAMLLLPALPLSYCLSLSLLLLCPSSSACLCARQFNLKPFSINLQ